MAMAANGRTETADSSRRKTRRQLMAGGAGALGAVAVASVARATPAAAANGDAVIMGQLNQSTSNTAINDSGGDTTFSVLATSSGTALEASAVDGIGVSASSSSAADHASAVFGEITRTSPGAFSAAVRGQNDGKGGDGIGVYGSQAGGGWGVYGTSASGIGVTGDGGSGIGVEGSGGTGVYGIGITGVHGTTVSAGGTGVLAENLSGGRALKVNGEAAFSRSGVATVLAGRSTVSQSLRLGSSSFVLATIQASVPGLYVQGVTIVPGSPGSFAIHLSKAVKAKTKVAWLVVN
jgi:hypothetical protein